MRILFVADVIGSPGRKTARALLRLARTESRADAVILNGENASGGFGTIITFTFDYLDQPERYRRHFELLGTEVIPRIRDIVHKTEPLSSLAVPEGA